ncbi:putative UPD-GlcNAc transporter (Mnn2-2) [Thermoascus aurantiacus ATCC 26904]
MVVMVSLIFGGCCANVCDISAANELFLTGCLIGPLITFVQFVVTALFTLPAFLSFSAGPRSLFLRPRAVPIKSWLIYTAFFMTVNLLNNWAFAYKISVPLHIILRSGGPVSSMAVGYLYNSKRYSRMQVLAVLLLTLGVVGAALADASAKGQSMEIGIGSDEDGSSLITSVTGFMILALAMILASFQGVYADRLYEMYGRSHWREALLYSHMLSLPFFLPTYPHLSSQFRALLSSPPMLSLLSSVVAYLLLNAVTQYLCIRGVHLLSANSSSLTVTIVLNIRKLVSLLLSIYLFGNVLATGVLVGAALVFIGGGLYGFEGARLRKRKEARKTE